jgi:endonuclease YncB( thermonuclease family)
MTLPACVYVLLIVLSLAGLNLPFFPNEVSSSTTQITDYDLSNNFQGIGLKVNSKIYSISTTINTTGINPVTPSCQGSSICLQGEVVKVVNGKSFFVNSNNRIIKVDLALISLPLNSEQAMLAAATFTRNTCLGSHVLVDHDDRQRTGDSMSAVVYCSPTTSLNEMLLDSGYAQIDKFQCTTSEFSILDWAKIRGC